MRVHALRVGLVGMLLALGVLASPLATPAFAAEALAQDSDSGYVRLEVHTTAQSGASVYLDHGREDLIQVGDRVQLHPTSGPMVQAIVRSVSRTSARAELAGSAPSLQVGDRGEVLLPRERVLAARRAEAEQLAPEPGLPRQVPEHPPWELDLSGLDSQAPLLAPVEAPERAERAAQMRGRVWFDYTTSEDREGTETSYDAARTGFDLTFDNAFGKGGELEFDASLFQRQVSVAGEDDESDSRLRLERLSYQIGGERLHPDSWRVGRFHAQGMPDFGLHDGLEYRQRLASGNSWGALIGALPEPNDELSSGDDLGLAVYHRWASDESERLTFDSGFQKTWHDGQADRDLVVLTSNWRPSDRSFLYASAWLDLYGSEDTAKDSGLELTRLIANGTWRTESGDGFGLTLSDFRFPELLRNEFEPVTAEQLASDRVTRVGMHGWKAVGDGLRLDARADRWQDQDDHGGRLQLGFTARDRLWDDGEVSLDLFQNENKYSSGPGLRLTGTRATPKGWLRLSYETLETQNDGFLGASEELTSDVLRGSWDLALGTSWDLSLSLEERFGDAEDATTLGFFLQKRFR